MHVRILEEKEEMKNEKVIRIGIELLSMFNNVS